MCPGLGGVPLGKGCVAKSGTDLSSILKPRSMEAENYFCKLFSDLVLRAHPCTRAHRSNIINIVPLLLTSRYTRERRGTVDRWG